MNFDPIFASIFCFVLRSYCNSKLFYSPCCSLTWPNIAISPSNIVSAPVSPRRYWPFSLSDEWTGKESGFYMSTAGTIASNASSFFVKYNNRAYLTNSCQGSMLSPISSLKFVSDSWDPNQFTKIRLLDQRITVTVDLSQIGCGCNLALYLVSMPGHSDGGKHEPDYYCDANDVGGVWCPEMDLLEANNMAMSVRSNPMCSINSSDNAS